MANLREKEEIAQPQEEKEKGKERIEFPNKEIKEGNRENRF